MSGSKPVSTEHHSVLHDRNSTGKYSSLSPLDPAKLLIRSCWSVKWLPGIAFSDSENKETSNQLIRDSRQVPAKCHVTQLHLIPSHHRHAAFSSSSNSYRAIYKYFLRVGFAAKNSGTLVALITISSSAVSTLISSAL